MTWMRSGRIAHSEKNISLAFVRSEVWEAEIWGHLLIKQHRPINPPYTDLYYLGGMKTYSLISPKVSRNPQTPTGRSKKCHLELCRQFERRGGAEGKIQAYLPQGMVRIGGEGTAQSRQDPKLHQNRILLVFLLGFFRSGNWCVRLSISYLIPKLRPFTQLFILRISWHMKFW